MVQIPRWKVWLIYAVCLLGILFSLPNFLSQSVRESLPGFMPTQTVNLGLDLQGGAHLLLEVDVNTVLDENFQNLTDSVRTTLRRGQYTYKNLNTENRQISFEVENSYTADQITAALREDLGTDVAIDTPTEQLVTIEFTDAYMQERVGYIMSQSIEIVRRRVDETGTKEPTIQQQGDDRIVLQLPGIDDPERIKSLLGKTAKLTFHLVDTKSMNLSSSARVPITSQRLPSGDAESGIDSYVIKRRAIITGDMLVDARPSFQEGRPVVSFKLDARGTKAFGDVTTKHVNEPFAIVLDREVISAPNINEPILGGRAIISGNFTTDEANDLALLLRAGALPAPLKVIEERTVGPGLGADSIEAGKIASIIGLVGVIIFIILSYGRFGIYAASALLLNLILILGALSMLQATLTLPGIAGIVLTIGMAVDANVLIFERIREELLNNRAPISATDAGYSSAYSSIVDANVTTLIAAVILFSFGTGPIKGFAVTLSIGIVTSMFSAILLTRLMVVGYLKSKRPAKMRI